MSDSGLALFLFRAGYDTTAIAERFCWFDRNLHPVTAHKLWAQGRDLDRIPDEARVLRAIAEARAAERREKSAHVRKLFCAIGDSAQS